MDTALQRINLKKIKYLIIFIWFRFVLCPECDNPETDLIVSLKRGTISQGCKACGYHGLLESNHKLVTFILKNPPNLNPAVQGSSLTEGKRSKRSKRNGETNGEQDEHTEAGVNTSVTDKSVDNVSFKKNIVAFYDFSDLDFFLGRQ